MKKLITLLFSFGAMATSFAQYNHGNNNRNDDYVYNQRDRYDRGYSSEREKAFMIARINREFDYKIQSIKNDRYLRRHEKKSAIKNAERERARQIHMVNERFKNRRNNDRYHKDHNDWNNTWNR